MIESNVTVFRNQENIIDLFVDIDNANGDYKGNNCENNAGGSSFRKWFVWCTHVGKLEL